MAADNALTAQLTGGFLDGYAEASTTAFHNLSGAAQWLFLVLALFSLAYAGLKWAINRENPTDGLAGLAMQLLSLSFAYAFLFYANVWVPAIIESFRFLGGMAIGGRELDPGLVFYQGVALANAVLSSISRWDLLTNPLAVMFGGWTAVFVVAAFSLIAVQMLLVTVSAYIIIGGSALFLAFAASPWTRSIADRFLAWVLSIGVQFFVLHLIIGTAYPLVETWSLQFIAAQYFSFTYYLSMMGGSILYLAVAWVVPARAGDVMLGFSTVGAHDALGATAITGGIVGGLMKIASRPLAFGKDAKRAFGKSIASARRASAAAGGGLTGAGAGMTSGAWNFAKEMLKSQWTLGKR